MFADEDRVFDVVINAEEQYSIWPSDRQLPVGWKFAGFSGPKSDCLAHIGTVWTDITPLNARCSTAGHLAGLGHSRNAQ